jgi:hypothetical protein
MLHRESRREGVVIIPWSQVDRVRVCTPSILVIDVVVNQFVGSSGSSDCFSPVEVKVFVTCCPAESLCGLIQERKELYKLRTQVLGMLRPSRRSSAAYSSLKERTLSLLNSKLSEVEQNIAKLDLEGVGRDAADVKRLDNKRTALLATLCRLRLYYAAALVCGINDNFDFSLKAAADGVSADVTAAEIVTGRDKAETCTRRVEAIMASAEARMKAACVGGWLFRGEALEAFLQQSLNGYLAELSKQFNELFVSEVHSEVRAANLVRNFTLT